MFLTVKFEEVCFESNAERTTHRSLAIRRHVRCRFRGSDEIAREYAKSSRYVPMRARIGSVTTKLMSSNIAKLTIRR